MENITDEQAIKLTKDAFDLIKQSKTVSELKAIPDIINIPIKDRMKTDGYPKIEFSLSICDIHSLINNKIIDDELNFTHDVTKRLTDPLSKLLYAIAWKNGDLSKVKHIIKGVIESKSCENNYNKALVFYQFGKFLTKTVGQPIIDQHVIRAFAVYKSINSNEKINELREIETLNKKHKGLISDYKDWLTSDFITKELKMIEDYSFYIDELLFAIGKTIKIKKHEKK